IKGCFKICHSLRKTMRNKVTCTFGYLPLLFLLGLLQFCNPKSPESGENASEEFYTMEDFGSVMKYDVHMHLRKDFDTLFIEQARANNFGFINVSVYSSSGIPPEQQEDFSVKLVEEFPGSVAYATAFSLENFNEDQWQEQTIAYLDSSFSKGAIGVKDWKNIGMELRDEAGNLVMIDDPRFDPVLDFIADEGITLIGHIGEPKNTWLPLDEMTVKGDRDYFSSYPQYHMYKLPEYPTYEEQIAARDRMLEKHPDLRFVGAHLGSLDWSVDALSERLDRFP